MLYLQLQQAFSRQNRCVCPVTSVKIQVLASFAMECRKPYVKVWALMGGAVCCVFSHRVLRRLTLEDAAAASHTFVTLMGEKVAPRRALIEAEGQKYTLEQLDI